MDSPTAPAISAIRPSCPYLCNTSSTRSITTSCRGEFSRTAYSPTMRMELPRLAQPSQPATGERLTFPWSIEMATRWHSPRPSTSNSARAWLLAKPAIVLNDQMDDFTPTGDRSDVFALSGSDANRIAPGKRPVSSMSPTIVLGDAGVELVAGAAGGPRIISATLQILLDVLAFGLDAGQAIAAPRIHHQWEPDELYYEASLPTEIVRALNRAGHITKPRVDIGKANVIVRSPAGLDAAADPRSGGCPAGY
jgi:hypothetical protein